MLTFFRLNSLFQVITLLILLLILRLPFFANGLPLLTTDLEYILTGEKLNEGLRLYSGILTQIGPLAGFFYGLMDVWAGKSPFLYEIVATVLIFGQTLYFVYIVNRRNLFNEKNYVAGLFFLIIISASFDLNKLSPALLSNIFILGALNVVLRQVEKRDGVGDDIFEAGLFIGFATLFHLSACVYILWACIGLAL